MHFSFVVASLLSFACAVNAVNYTVLVGNTTLTYTPSYLEQVMEGDNIIFKFFPKDHTATQSTFANPCTRMAGGFTSGFQPFNGTGPQPTYVYTVTNASAPIWVYCGQTGHCQDGMVFAINPTANKTFAQFQANAKALATNISTSAAPSGTATTPASGTALTPASGTATGTASGASTTNAGMKVGSSAAGTLAIALLVGLAL